MPPKTGFAGAPRTPAQYRPLERAYRMAKGKDIPPWKKTQRGPTLEEHYRRHRAELFDAARPVHHELFDHDGQHRHVIVTVRGLTKSTLLKGPEKGRHWYHVSDLDATPIIRELGLPASGRLSPDDLRAIREHVIRHFDYIEVDSDVEVELVEDLTHDDVHVHELDPPEGGTDPAREAMRSFKTLAFDEDETLNLLLTDAKFKEIYDSLEDPDVKCVIVYLTWIMARHPDRHKTWTVDDTREACLTGMEDFGVLDAKDDGKYDSCVIIERDYGGDWRRYAAVKDVEGYTPTDVLRFCMNKCVNLLLFTPDTMFVSPFMQWRAHAPHSDTNHEDTIVGVVTCNHLCIPSESFRRGSAQKYFGSGGGFAASVEKKKKKEEEGPEEGVDIVFIPRPKGQPRIELMMRGWDAFVDSVEKYGIPPQACRKYDRDVGWLSWHYPKLNVGYSIGDNPKHAKLAWSAFYPETPYRGQSIAQLLGALREGDPIGHLSRSVHDAFTKKNVKDGHLRGVSTNLRRDPKFDIRTFNFKELATPFDAIKAYSAILARNALPYPLLQHEDEVVTWPHGDSTPTIGDLNARSFYFFEIADRAPDEVWDYFQKKRGLTSFEFLADALMRGMGPHITITAVVTASKTKPADHYLRLQERISQGVRAKLSSTDADAVFKDMTRHLGGTLGRTAKTDARMYMTSSKSEAMRHMMTMHCLGRDPMIVTTHAGRAAQIPVPGPFECPAGLRLADGNLWWFVHSVARQPVLRSDIGDYLVMLGSLALHLIRSEEYMRRTFGYGVTVFRNTDGFIVMNPTAKTTKAATLKRKQLLASPIQAVKWQRTQSKDPLLADLGMLRVKPMDTFVGRDPVQRSAERVVVKQSWRVDARFTDSDEYAAIIDSAIEKGGVCLTGEGGSGKSYVIRKAVEHCIANNKRYVVLANTNAALQLFPAHYNTQTIASFLRKGKKGKVCPAKIDKQIRSNAHKYDVIIIDESSMVHIDDLARIAAMLDVNPDIRFFVFGDPTQLEPVEIDRQRIGEHAIDSSIMMRMCRLNRVMLRTNHRTGDPLIRKLAMAMLEGSASDKDAAIAMLEAVSTLPQLNIAYSNAMCQAVNELMMEGKAFKAIVKMKFGADAKLYRGLPLVCVDTFHAEDKEHSYYNSNRFEIVSIDVRGKSVVLAVATHGRAGGTRGKGIRTDRRRWTVTFEELSLRFAVGFCITIHKAQGATFDFTYGIIEIRRLRTRAANTAVTRATHSSNIKIETPALLEKLKERESRIKGLEIARFLTEMRKIIPGYRHQDRVAGRDVAEDDEFIDPPYLEGLWVECDGECVKCQRRMSIVADEATVSRKVTVERDDNALPHVKRNCTRLLCHACNSADLAP